MNILCYLPRAENVLSGFNEFPRNIQSSLGNSKKHHNRVRRGAE
jgi:hypothetical protein